MDEPKRQTRSSKNKEKALQEATTEETNLSSTDKDESETPPEEGTINESLLQNQDEGKDETETAEPRTEHAKKLPEKNTDDKPKRKQVAEKNKTENVQNKGHNSMYYIVVILPIFICVGIVAIKNYSDQIVSIEVHIEQLANDFQGQSPYSFKKLKSRMLPYVTHKTSPQPFVLLVASMPDDQPTAECFANRVAKLLTPTSVIINGSEYLHTKSDDAKLEIDDRLRNVFQKGKFPTAAVIHNLDLIPYGTTTLFYAYCDHDNPMYNEAAIIFTITLPQSYEISDNEHHREQLIEKYLAEDSPWVKEETFSLDVMGALISRITDTVIVVNNESTESLEKFC